MGVVRDIKNYLRDGLVLEAIILGERYAKSREATLFTLNRIYRVLERNAYHHPGWQQSKKAIVERMYRKATGAATAGTFVATFATTVLSILGLSLVSAATFLGLTATAGRNVLRNVRDHIQRPRLRDGDVSSRHVHVANDRASSRSTQGSQHRSGERERSQHRSGAHERSQHTAQTSRGYVSVEGQRTRNDGHTSHRGSSGVIKRSRNSR